MVIPLPNITWTPAEPTAATFIPKVIVIVLVYAEKLIDLHTLVVVSTVQAEELASKIKSSATVGTAPPRVEVLPVLQFPAVPHVEPVSPLQ